MIDYIKALASTMMEAHDRLYVEKANYARTIPIPTLGVGTTEFDLSKERALALFDSGRGAAEKFLEKWDFDAYIAEFRAGKQHSRREALVASMSKDGAPRGARRSAHGARPSRQPACAWRRRASPSPRRAGSARCRAR